MLRNTAAAPLWRKGFDQRSGIRDQRRRRMDHPLPAAPARGAVRFIKLLLRLIKESGSKAG
ncbi:MAG: hypothetical protein NW241_10360 [Bacteroidia bacterium]|nr:hypothetical protein [Bacteroidia bacterium]